MKTIHKEVNFILLKRIWQYAIGDFLIRERSLYLKKTVDLREKRLKGIHFDKRNSLFFPFSPFPLAMPAPFLCY